MAEWNMMLNVLRASCAEAEAAMESATREHEVIVSGLRRQLREEQEAKSKVQADFDAARCALEAKIEASRGETYATARRTR